MRRAEMSTKSVFSSTSPPPEASPAVPTLTISEPGCVPECASTESNGQFSIYHCSKLGGRRSSLNSSLIAASIPEKPETEEQEEEDRIEAELDEMSRWVGPVAKSLFTPVVAPLVDANSFADALGVSPLYKQKETQRWTSALNMYRQISSQEQNGIGQQPMSRLSEDDELAQLCTMSSSNGDAIVGDFDENLVSTSARPSAPPPREVLAAPIAIPATTRQQASRQQNIASSASSVKSVLSPPFTPRMGFMTPPTAAMWAMHQNSSGAATAYVVSPPRRKSSSVSPNEASLNSLELEAIAAVHELQFAVKDIYVSEMLPRTSELIFLNVTTLEGQAFSVELTLKGWRVTSLRHDCMNGDINHLDLHILYFETIYALMDRISPDYRRRFTDALMTKLSAIEAERRDDGYDSSKSSSTKIHQGVVENDENARLEQEQRQTFT